MKKIITMLFLSLLVFGNVFALDFDKIEQVWDKSLDIAITELDNLDFDIPRAEDVEAKVNNDMYVTELESKVAQLEAEVRLLKREKDKLKEAYDGLKEENRRAKNINDGLCSELLLFKTGGGIYLTEREWDSIELEIKLLEKENDKLKELLKRKIKY